MQKPWNGCVLRTAFDPTRTLRVCHRAFWLVLMLSYPTYTQGTFRLQRFECTMRSLTSVIQQTLVSIGVHTRPSSVDTRPFRSHGVGTIISYSVRPLETTCDAQISHRNVGLSLF
ncbi:hypothetical protein F5I97DRAFT_206616 [Phlebopus sp. FC_14]|nr:hypothetical protein F5I97DRAFT_206616 [Phlebopus sp. FC_14]